MNAQDILDTAVQLIGRQSQKTVPSVLQPIRDVSNMVGSQFEDLRPNSSSTQFNSMSPQQKLANVLKAAISYGGQGLAEGGGNGIASALSVSPPAQLAEYAMGKPDPKKQAQHALEAIAGALTVGGVVRPFTPKPYFSNAKWVPDLLGGIR